MKRQELSNCIFSSWYNNFKQVTFKSYILKLPEDFIDYLNRDGIILPDNDEVKYSNELNEYSDDEDWGESYNENNSQPTFPDLKKQIDESIRKLGGSCFVKLNWSSPKDAGWISRDGTLKCSSFNDICLLLKSSDFITHDLTKPYEHCNDSLFTQPKDQYELVLRRYIDIIPGMEFRCFVKSNKLIAISQRHHATYFDYLLPLRDNLENDILNFYNANIKSKFADSNFVFDIYKSKSGRIQLVDFNPFGKLTDSLLYDWEELHEICLTDAKLPYFRIITSSDGGIQPGPNMTYGLPRDTIDLACGEDYQKMIDFFNVNKLIVKPGDEDSQ